MANVSLSQFFPKTFLNENNLERSLGEDFSLCENGNMIFHWADFHETCDTVKTALANDPILKDDFEKKEMGLSRLGHIPVWIRTQSKVHQTTMFDLYERYILNQSNNIGVDPFGPIEVSFISGTGPFKGMAIAECFNKSTYKDFVLVYLLKGKLPKRDFRIRLKSKILMEYGHDLNAANLVSLEQITANGLLLSMESDLFLKEVSKSPQLRILLDTNVLKNSMGKNLGELQTYLSEYTFNLFYTSNKNDGITCTIQDFSIQSSFDFLKNKKVYLFISFNNLAKTHPESVKNLQGFVTYSREIVRTHYQDFSKKHKSA